MPKYLKKMHNRFYQFTGKAGVVVLSDSTGIIPVKN